MALHTYLTLGNGAKRSVSKGGDAKDVVQAVAMKCADAVRVATLRDAPLARSS